MQRFSEMTDELLTELVRARLDQEGIVYPSDMTLEILATTLDPTDLKCHQGVVVKSHLGSRRLRCRWSPDVLRNLQSFHNLYPGVEVDTILVDNIVRELIELSDWKKECPSV